MSSPLVVMPDDSDAESRKPGFLRWLFSDENSAAITSLGVHVGGLLILALLVIPASEEGRSLISLAVSSISASESELADFEISAPSAVETEDVDEREESIDLDLMVDSTELEEAMMPDLSAAALPLPDVAPETDAAASDDMLLDQGKPPAARRDRGRRERPTSAVAFMPTISKKGISVQEPLRTSVKDGVKQTATTESAAAGVLGAVGKSLDQDGQVWVLWVMDASLSLLEERQVLGGQVFTFYQQIKLGDASRARPKPKTKVFAFGQQVVNVATDLGTANPTAMARSIMALPIDETGVENVLTAVYAAISSVPTRKPLPRIEVVVWTDESGDDLAMLEDVITFCHTRNARVHVVGPLSVFGMERGLQQFTLPAPYNSAVFLPVRRGPDSVFPERAQLPLWFEAGDIDWANSQIIPASQSLQKAGGPHRERLLAPSGPYGLTRLALATGGTFTALNRRGDLAPASRAELFDYMPDYRSGMEIAYDVDKYPLRKAIIEAAALTGTVAYWPPPQRYPMRASVIFPFASQTDYVQPEVFPRRLGEDLGVAVRRLRSAQRMIEMAIQVMTLRFQSNEYQGYEDEANTELKLGDLDLDGLTPQAYKDEASPRWRAWYDLNLGRLLAHSIRIDEYIRTAEYLASRPVGQEMLQRQINMVSLFPSTNLRGDSVTQKRIEMSVKLLGRVVADHPDTPWSDLAAWELQNACGMDVRFDFVPPPPPAPPVTPSKMPALPKL
jgi:hypothetical protein